MRSCTDSKSDTEKQPVRGNHPLVANDLVVGKSERKAELDTLIAFCDNAFAWLQRQSRKRERKPRLKTQIKQVEAATGRPAAGVTFAPDGSRTIAVGSGEGEDANGADANPWDMLP